MPPRFEPSPSSITPKKRALLTLQYARKAIEALEGHLNGSSDQEEVPAWVLTRINQGASSFGSALSFLSFKSTLPARKTVAAPPAEALVNPDKKAPKVKKP